MDGKKVELRPKKLTVTRWNGSKTRGLKSKKAKAGTSKKMGAKSFSGREHGQDGTVSSQCGILRYFSSSASPEEVGSPMGLGTPLQIPAEKKGILSVLQRPMSKKECL